MICSVLLAGLAVAWSAGRIADAWHPLAMAVAWIAGAGLLLAVPAAWLKRSVHFAVAAPAFLLACDLAFSNGPNESTGLPPANYDVLKPNCTNATIRFLKERLRKQPGSPWRDRVELVGLGFDWQNAALVHGFEGTLGYNPFRLAELSQATGARDYIAGPDQKTFSPLFPSYSSPMADLLGIRFVAVGVPIERIDRKLRPGDLQFVARTPDAFIYENPDVLPRVLFVSDWNRVDFDQLGKTGNWPHFDPRQTVLLEKSPRLSQPLVSLANLSTVAGARVRRYENTKVVIDVDAARPGFVVLHDLWHPWWIAQIDGRDTDILRANVLFRAVQVPAGSHVVTFEFRPVTGAVTELSDKLFQRAGPGSLKVETMPHP